MLWDYRRCMTGPAGWEATDVLSGGSENPPPRIKTLLLIVAAGCLAAGLLVGATTDIPRRLGLSPELSRQPVAVGAIREDPIPAEVDGPRFMLPVFNSTDEEIEASIKDIAGWIPREVEPAVGIPVGEWRTLSFFPPAGCGRIPDGQITEVRLLVAGSSGRDEWPLQLPEPAQDLGNYYLAACAEESTVRADDLTGVWLVDEVFGIRTNLERTMLIRFNHDGTYSGDAEGNLFSTAQLPVDGTFVVSDARLTLSNTLGWACEPPKSSTARISRLPLDGRLALAFLEGNCPHEPNGVWLIRRLLSGDDLPRTSGRAGP